MSLRRWTGFAVLILMTGAAAPAPAHEHKTGALTIAHPWVRVVPGSPVGAGYLTVTNAGAADRLVGASVAGAGRVELHVSSHEGGVARMRPVEGGLAIGPRGTLTLAPGGAHLMLLDLKGPVVDGELVQGTLRFEKAGAVPVEFEARTSAAPHAHGSGEH